MESKIPWMVAVTLGIGLAAIGAVALAPGNLANLTAPGGTTSSPGTASIETPVWHVGDTWTYEVNASSPDAWSGGPFIAGTLTRRVVSADGAMYNVSIQGTFHVGGLEQIAMDTDLANASVLLTSHVTLNDATVNGYAWYRASDLAELKDVRTVRLSGSLHTDFGDVNASYTAKVETTFDPALNVWSFPLGENETWNVSSNATIHAWIKWRVDSPNAYFEAGRNFTATVPVRFLLRSGSTTDVATPAGTFSSIPVRLALPGTDLATTGDPLGLVMGLGTDAFMEPHVPVEASFSGTVGNVVKAVALVDGARIEAVLASYHRS